MDPWIRQQNINMATAQITEFFNAARDANQKKLDAVTNAQIEWNDAWTHHDRPDFTSELLWSLFFAALAFVPAAAYTAAIGYAFVRELALTRGLLKVQEGLDVAKSAEVAKFFANYRKISDQNAKYKDLLSLGSDQAKNAVTRIQAMTNFARSQSLPRKGSAGLSADAAILQFKDQFSGEKTFLTRQQRKWTDFVNESMGEMVETWPWPYKALCTPAYIEQRVGRTEPLTTPLSALSDQFEKQLWMTYVANNVVLNRDLVRIDDGMEMTQFDHIKRKEHVWHIHEVQDLQAWGARVSEPHRKWDPRE